MRLATEDYPVALRSSRAAGARVNQGPVFTLLIAVILWVVIALLLYSLIRYF